MTSVISGNSIPLPISLASNQETNGQVTTLGNGNGNGPPTEQASVDTVTLSDEAKLLLEKEQSTVTTLGNGNGNGPPAAPNQRILPLGSGNGNDPPL